MEVEGRAKEGAKKWGLAAAVAREKRKAPVPQKYCEFLTLGHVHETDMESETRFRAEAESCRVIGREQKNGRAPLLNLAGHFLLNRSISPGIGYPSVRIDNIHIPSTGTNKGQQTFDWG